MVERVEKSGESINHPQKTRKKGPRMQLYRYANKINLTKNKSYAILLLRKVVSVWNKGWISL